MPKKTSSKDLVPRDQDYHALLQELKSIIAQGQFKAYKAVDNLRVQTYWQLGERIVREELKHKGRADYGKYLIENLSDDLGLSLALLYDIVKFNNTYKIFHAVRGELSWTHYRQLIYIDNPKERSFYEHQIILYSWSSRELKKRIKSGLYEHTPKKEIENVFQTRLSSTPIRTKKNLRTKFSQTLRNFYVNWVKTSPSWGGRSL